METARLWVTRDYADPKLYLHPAKPYDKDGEWYNEEQQYLQLSDDLFPSVTYENSPRQVELKLI